MNDDERPAPIFSGLDGAGSPDAPPSSSAFPPPPSLEGLAPPPVGGHLPPPPLAGALPPPPVPDGLPPPPTGGYLPPPGFGHPPASGWLRAPGPADATLPPPPVPSAQFPPPPSPAPAPPPTSTGWLSGPSASSGWSTVPTVDGPPPTPPTAAAFAGVGGPSGLIGGSGPSATGGLGPPLRADRPAGLPSTPPLHDHPSAPTLLPDGADVPTARPLSTFHPGRRGGWRTVLGSGLSALVAALVVAAAFLIFDDPGGGGGSRPSSVISGEELDIAALLDKAGPSVVTIETDTTTVGGVFGGAGSGVVISEDGLVLTNAHVIGGADSIRVALFDGSTEDAELVGSFPDEDIALLRIEPDEPLVAAELGESAELAVGDEVVAIGNALNLGASPSVTRGIVSALDRSIEAPGIELEHLIQTDAAINPGNSGGPLLNSRGQVVGINTAIIDDAQNIGFALAIDPLKPLIDDLKEGNGDITAETPFLGVSTNTVEDVIPEVLEEYDVTSETGAFVVDLVPDSAAEAAGIEIGDVIVAIDGEPTETSEDVVAEVRRRAIGDTMEIELERAGESRTVEAELTER